MKQGADTKLQQHKHARTCNKILLVTARKCQQRASSHFPTTFFRYLSTPPSKCPQPAPPHIDGVSWEVPRCNATHHHKSGMFLTAHHLPPASLCPCSLPSWLAPACKPVQRSMNVQLVQSLLLGLAYFPPVSFLAP